MELSFQPSERATAFGNDPHWVLSFDREGRLLSYARGEAFYRRALDSRLFQRHRREGQRWRLLPDGERRSLFGEAYSLAAEVARGAPDELRRRLETEVLPWSEERLLAEEERFRRAYLPISILPPDRYLAIVLQATQGCTWNRCTFCSFYQGRPFHAAEPEEFRGHVEAVRDLLGRDVARRRSIFLADGNALALGNRRLRPIFAAACETFPGQAVTSFIDVYTGSRHEPTDWRELAALGLTQVYVGMETGLDELLRCVNKPGSRAELEAFVAEVKAAGLAVSLIAMVGLGGRSYRVAHREATLDVFAAMPLGRSDLIYLSPFVDEPGSAYAERRAAEGLEPMTAEEIDVETAAWAAELRGRGLRVGRYDIREFIY